MSKTNGSVAMTFQAAIAGLQWPLDDAHDAPLYFKPLEEMVEIRRKEKRAADAAGAAIAANVRTSIASLLAPVANANDPNLSEQDQEHYARIAVALLLLGHGYTDEAHNLVSPLSWTKETVFGYGPPTITSINVMAVSSYAHSLVHRREAHHASEYNMTGFGNANYWASAALRGAVETLPLAAIRTAVLKLAASSAFVQAKSVQCWIHTNMLSGPAVVDGWDPRLAHELCATILSKEANGKVIDAPLRAFAQSVAETELRVLLGHTLRCLGYECDNILRKL